jgi:hypothetical protein
MIKVIDEGTQFEYWDYSVFDRSCTGFINVEGLYAIGDTLYQVTDKELKSIKISDGLNKTDLLNKLNKKISPIKPFQKIMGTSPGLISSGWVTTGSWPSVQKRINLEIELTCVNFVPQTSEFDFKHNVYVKCQKTNLFNSWIYDTQNIQVTGDWQIQAYYYPQRYMGSYSFSGRFSLMSLFINPDTGVSSPLGTYYSIFPDSANQTYDWEFQQGNQPIFVTNNWSATRTDINLTASVNRNMP